MKKDKISKAEKMILKGLVELMKEQGIEPISTTCRYLENQMKDVTGNCFMEHRQMIEDYAQALINKSFTEVRV